MCADRDSSPGLRALLGRFLHGLLRYRVFQLLGAAWSYLIGQSGASLLSFLPSAWLLHRPVGPDELPEVLEALGLRPWEELGDCLEELGPWKELLSPAMKADVDGMWPGYGSSSRGQESWDGAMEGLGSWHSRVRALWEPGTWTELVDSAQEDDDEFCSKSSAGGTSWKNLCAEDGEECGARALGVVSCVFHPGSGGAFTWLDVGPDHSPDTDVLSDPRVEIEHIRNKRLWFLQLNQGQDAARDDGRQDVTGPSTLTKPTLLNLDLAACGRHEGHNGLVSDLELTGSDSKHGPLSSLLVQKADVLGSTQSNHPPSPDQDQGYHSLEDWQCINITKNLQSGGMCPPHASVSSAWNNDWAHVPAELSCSAIKDLEDDEGSDDMDSDLEEEIHAPALPVCTNKHISYILGTVLSDDEEEDSGSSCDDDDEEDDDGFDSEGSLSTTESDSPVLEDVVQWTSLCSDDPYNPQNFTATLQTGPVVAAVTPHTEEQDAVLSTDEESWCDSEDEFIADEQENLRLWNGFLTSEDPYNPFFFKASLQTFEPKRLDSDTVTKELVCTSPPSCELTAPTHPSDTRPLRVREKHCVSMKQRANAGRKKVTFYEKVTIYYVCNEEERKGHWEEFARDRCRFQRRIQETESVIGRCFTSDHRQRVWNQMQEMWGS